MLDETRLTKAESLSELADHWPSWLDHGVTRADLGKDPRQVAKMFDQVAGRYDLTNDVLSAGQTAGWRRATTKAVAPEPGEKF